MQNAARQKTLGGALVVVGIAVGVWGFWWYSGRSVGAAQRPAVTTNKVVAAPSGDMPTSTDSKKTETEQAQRNPAVRRDESALTAEAIAAAPPYPVQLEALRARLPNNRFWALGAPTSDPAVAKARAARAERDNAAMGRITANDASPEEVRAYYTERRAISRDYLQVAELVLAEQGEALPERDRGAFELSVNLHRARLQQIDRDESDALARLEARKRGSATP